VSFSLDQIAIRPIVIAAFDDEMDKIAGAQAPAGDVQAPAPEQAPAHQIVSPDIKQLDPRTAHSTPILEPPPGYVYAPELGSFIPNPQDPGWIAQGQAIEALRNKAWFDQGQQQQVQQAAQGQLDQAASQNLEAAAQEQQQAQQQQQVEQAANTEATLEAAKQEGKQMADAAGAPPNQGQPEYVGAQQAAQGPRRKPKPKEDKGVVIRVGK
jgi:hypothetical protein